MQREKFNLGGVIKSLIIRGNFQMYKQIGRWVGGGSIFVYILECYLKNLSNLRGLVHAMHCNGPLHQVAHILQHAYTNDFDDVHMYG